MKSPMRDISPLSSNLNVTNHTLNNPSIADQMFSRNITPKRESLLPSTERKLVTKVSPNFCFRDSLSPKRY